jgi:hypothetical protein
MHEIVRPTGQRTSGLHHHYTIGHDSLTFVGVKKSHLLPISAQWWVNAPTRTAREPMALYVFTFYSVMNVLANASMVDNFILNISQ